ncbi:MAG: hypothetical protein ACTS27_10145 [Phycisphaerales bacterium]
MSFGIFVPIIVLAIAIALVRAMGVLMVKPRSTERVYTKPVISGSWGQQQATAQQTDTTSREPHA